MKRNLFVLFLLLFSVNFWYLKPIGGLFAGNLGLFIQLAFIAVSAIYYLFNIKNPFLLVRAGYCRPLIWIYAAVIISFIPAYLNFGQSPSTSFFASKCMLLFLALPALLIVRPSYKDIEGALYVFSIIYFVITVFDSVLKLPVIDKIEGLSFDSNKEYIAKGEFVHALEGIHFVGMAFIFSLYRLRKQIAHKSIFISFLLLAEIFLVQNRSTLFICVIFLLYSLFTLQLKKYKILIRTSILILAIFFVFLTLNSWISLLQETVEQLGSTQYNRNLAWAYFLTEACPGPLEYFIGNGFLSAKSTPFMQDLMELGVYNSDVGFIGFWNQYGLIPVIGFITLFAKVIVGKRYGFIAKCNSWFILACSMTTAYFAQDNKIIWACLFLYIFSVEDFLSRSKINKVR